jgi:outer membrane protein
MSHHLKPVVPVKRFTLTMILLSCALSCSAQAIAEETSDFFSSGVNLTHSPSLMQTCENVQTGHPLDLFSVVNIALCNNPQTREAWANSRAQAAQIGVNQASYLPGVSAAITGNRNSPGNSQRSLSLNLSYLLYDFGARAANLENARQTLTAVNATQDNTVQTLFLAAVQAYYQARATRAAFDASIISEHAAQTSFEAAQARYLAGSATPADKLTAQTAYSQATLNRITAAGAMKIAQGTLANILGLDANSSVILTDATPEHSPPEKTTSVDSRSTALRMNSSPRDEESMKILEQDIAELIEQARKSRPDLLAAKAQINAAKALADAARAAAKPTITMTASTNQNTSAGINTQGSTLGLSLTAPLFSGYAPTYRIRAAEAQIETRKAQMERINLQVALDVWTAYQNLATTTQNRRTTSQLLESAEQSERVALGRYKAGAGIMLDLLNAQNTLAGARQQRIQADLNWNISRAALAQAMGSLDAELLQTLPDTDALPKP